MIPRLVPKISPLDAFCDVAGEVVVVVGIGDSRSRMSSHGSLFLKKTAAAGFTTIFLLKCGKDQPRKWSRFLINTAAASRLYRGQIATCYRFDQWVSQIRCKRRSLTGFMQNTFFCLTNLAKSNCFQYSLFLQGCGKSEHLLQIWSIRVSNLAVLIDKIHEIKAHFAWLLLHTAQLNCSQYSYVFFRAETCMKYINCTCWPSFEHLKWSQTLKYISKQQLSGMTPQTENIYALHECFWKVAITEYEKLR